MSHSYISYGPRTLEPPGVPPGTLFSELAAYSA